MAAVLAPIIEECIFRAPLFLFRKYTKGFKYVFYIIVLIFGFIHLSNFKISTTILIVSPLLVAPQIIAGLLLGYIRVRLGLLYSILLHALFNGLAIIPSLLLT
jgi:membrane protease YdiL (CAAX protease family)